ncbi:MAPK regulated corepressor interacting protein 2 isoform X2 [Nycticebus coucang]|uniref:MAPK regulated corepressor interacting protein 2 isoform X2 n=1 Tax=Nycticebus coucang TaxID=9470 RepID=UPI00234D34DB|nr:MAPK regulated corepressor interacting protein 2 isoform X2 [Nycticebus coucang]
MLPGRGWHSASHPQGPWVKASPTVLPGLRQRLAFPGPRAFTNLGLRPRGVERWLLPAPPLLHGARPGQFPKGPERRLCRVPLGLPEPCGPFKGWGRVAGPPPPRSAGRGLNATPGRAHRSWLRVCVPGSTRRVPHTRKPARHVHPHQGAQQAGRAASHRSHAAAGGEQARRAFEMPAAHAADRATPAGATLRAAAGTLAPVESGAKACVQSCERPAAPCHVPIS